MRKVFEIIKVIFFVLFLGYDERKFNLQIKIILIAIYELIMRFLKKQIILINKIELCNNIVLKIMYNRQVIF